MHRQAASFVFDVCTNQSFSIGVSAQRVRIVELSHPNTPTHTLTHTLTHWGLNILKAVTVSHSSLSSSASAIWEPGSRWRSAQGPTHLQAGLAEVLPHEGLMQFDGRFTSDASLSPRLGASAASYLLLLLLLRDRISLSPQVFFSRRAAGGCCTVWSERLPQSVQFAEKQLYNHAKSKVFEYQP